MPGRAALYLRDGKVIVVPQAECGDAQLDMAPVRVVDSEANAVSAAIADALEVSSTARSPTPGSDDRDTSPLLAAVRARSLRHFYRGATHCRVIEEDHALRVLECGPAIDRGSFEPTGHQPRVVADLRALGPVVIDCLQQARRMPPA
jgi:hypothetical protein